MKLLIVLSSLLVATFAASTNKLCKGVRYKGQYYDKVLLKTGLDRPFLLAVDYETDTLYFNYNIAADEYRSARLNLRTKEFQDIKGIPDGFSHAIDSKNHLLYIGTRSGIYVYNLKTNQSNFLGARGKFIWTLFFKDDMLYFSEYPSQRFFTYSNGKVERLEDLKHTKAHFFVLDNDNEMFFTNNTGLYKLVKGTTDAVLYKTFKHHWEIRALTLDLSGNVYAGLDNGVYTVKRDEAEVERVFPVRDLFGLTFDGDNNIVYADDFNVIQLKHNKNC